MFAKSIAAALVATLGFTAQSAYAQAATELQLAGVKANFERTFLRKHCIDNRLTYSFLQRHSSFLSSCPPSIPRLSSMSPFPATATSSPEPRSQRPPSRALRPWKSSVHPTSRPTTTTRIRCSPSPWLTLILSVPTFPETRRVTGSPTTSN